MRLEVSEIISEFAKRETGKKKPIILAAGLSGTGKTLNSRYLAKKLGGYEVLNLEDLRNDLNVTSFSRKDTPMLHTIVVYNIEKMNEEGKGVIFDANLKSYDLRETYYYLAKSLGKEVILIEFFCDDAEAKRRISERKLINGKITHPKDPSFYDLQKKVWQDVSLDVELNDNVSCLKYDSFNDKTQIVKDNDRQREFIQKIIGLMEGKKNDLESFPNGL